MRTSFYIDGFNLYFNAVSDSPHKWLDLGRLCSRIVPDHHVTRIRYFTAPVEGIGQTVLARDNDRLPICALCVLYQT